MMASAGLSRMQPCGLPAAVAPTRHRPATPQTILIADILVREMASEIAAWTVDAAEVGEATFGFFLDLREAWRTFAAESSFIMHSAASSHGETNHDHRVQIQRAHGKARSAEMHEVSEQNELGTFRSLLRTATSLASSTATSSMSSSSVKDETANIIIRCSTLSLRHSTAAQAQQRCTPESSSSSSPSLKNTDTRWLFLGQRGNG